MPRPHIFSLTLIQNETSLNLKGSIALTDQGLSNYELGSDVELKKIKPPFKSLNLLWAYQSRIKIVGYSKDEVIFIKEYDTDSLGNLDLKIPLKTKIDYLNIYDLKARPGLELIMGSFIPLNVEPHSKLIVSDFDRTLVETRFSTIKDIYHSLKTPVLYFPDIPDSLNLLKKYIDNGYIPFILSASPHFYENSLRDWAYKNNLCNTTIFLKDYKSIFTIGNGILSTKDLKKQGFYKLTQLVNLLLMTGIPSELILMGDAFESDLFIYSCLISLIYEKQDPWVLWKMIRKEKPFRLTTKQDSLFLTKFYQLSELANKKRLKDFKIYIRGEIKTPHTLFAKNEKHYLNRNVSFY